MHKAKEGGRGGEKENEIDERATLRVSNTTHPHFSIADHRSFSFLLLEGDLLEDEEVVVGGHVFDLDQPQLGLGLGDLLDLLNVADSPRGVAASKGLVKLCMHGQLMLISQE